MTSCQCGQCAPCKYRKVAEWLGRLADIRGGRLVSLSVYVKTPGGWNETHIS